MKTLVAIFITLLGSTLYAQSIGRVSYGGTGCPQNTLSYSYLSTSRELVLNYRAFNIRSGGNSRQSLDRKACAITVPVQVPAGYQMMLSAKSTGSTLVRQGGRVTLNMETFYAGSTGVTHSKVYRAGQHRINIGELMPKMAWSPCGQSTNLRMNLSAVSEQDANITLRQMRLKILLRRCQS